MLLFIKLVAVLALSAGYLNSECPIHAKIGNAINFLHLFKEQADSDWNYQNLKTSFKLRLHQVTPKKGCCETHRIVFQVNNLNNPGRKWLYCIEAVYDEAEILLKISKFARFRLFENAKDSTFSNRLN